MKPLSERSFGPDEPVIVSVCVCAYNQSTYLPLCLDGILAQRCDFRVEVIVNDDCSTDGTREILEEYQRKFPTVIRAIFHEENQFSKGVNPQYAYTLPSSAGRYFAICDGDDYWDDDGKLAYQVSVLEAEPDVAVTYGPVRKIDETGEISDFMNGREADMSPAELRSCQGINTLTTCGRNIFKGLPPPMYLRNSPIGDLTMWALLGYHGSGKYLADLKPAIYRVHSGGIMSKQSFVRQQTMTMLAHLSVAAHHLECGEIHSARRSADIGLEHLLVKEEPEPLQLFKLLVRALKKKLR